MHASARRSRIPETTNVVPWPTLGISMPTCGSTVVVASSITGFMRLCNIVNIVMLIKIVLVFYAGYDEFITPHLLAKPEL